MAFCGDSTHLFLAAKQASTHVPNHAPIAFSTLFTMIVSVREIVIAAIVRHIARFSPPGGQGD
jgi:hypothetical protein